MSLVLDGTTGIVTLNSSSQGVGGSATNTALGSQALSNASQSGTGNTAIGAQALYSNQTGYSLTAVGGQALYSNTGAHNTGIGYQALYSYTGSNSTAVGDNAGYALTSGIRNTILGAFAMPVETTGQYNIAIGFQSLYTQNGASNNTAVGYQAGYSNTTGAGNTVCGMQALYTNSTGPNNTVVGQYALNLATGSTNTAIGYGSGSVITTGNKNSILGAYSGNQGGLDIRTANNYIVLSDGDGNPRAYFDAGGEFVLPPWTTGGSAIAAGQTGFFNDGGYGQYLVMGNTYGSGKDFVQFKNSTTTIGRIYASSASATAYVTSSDYRLKENVQPMIGALAKVAQLKPCTFTWKIDNTDGQGFIAHELAEVFPDAVAGKKDEVDEDGNPEYQGVDTSFLVATLTAAIQELKAEIDALKGAK